MMDNSESGLSKSTLKDLIVTRSSIKGQITKFKNYLTCVNSKDELTSIELAELGLKLTKFEGLSVKFDNLQNAIEVLNSENINIEIDNREGIETDIIICIATAKTLIEKYDRIENQQRRDSLALENPCLHDHQELGFKLPQIQISKFDGSYFRWLEFKDTFESLIHSNSRIKPIHKFHYLISYLEGDAARIISNLEVSSVNYAEAWKLLGERYNNKRLLINHHLSSLFNIQPLNRETDRSLRFLVDHVTKNLRALSSLGQPTDKWDTLIIFMLSSKLDNNTLVKWEEYRNTLDDDVPTLDKFQKFLTDRADVLESLGRNKQDGFQSKPTTSAPSQNNKFNSKPQTYNNYNKPFKSSGPFTKSFASVNQPRQNYICIICNENHKIYDCPSFKSKNMKEKLADVANYKLCSNCLRQGHPVNDCRMGPCRECKKKHNSLLHPVIPENINETTSNTASVVNFSEQNCTQGQILLSTALVEVMNPSTNDVLKIRAILDCGSQSTFITKSLKENLSLKSNRIDSLKVIGIGKSCTNTVIETCNIKLNSINSKFSVKLSCLVLKDLTGELPKSPVDINKINIPKNLLLADPNFHKPAPIDMLIGADIFWDILGNEQISLGPELPKLRSSKLGWLVSGPTKTYANTIITNKNIQCNHVSITKSTNSIDDLLTKFWELEEVPETKTLYEKEHFCEKHFLANLSRLNTGRFMVKLPVTQSPDNLGDSYYLAKRRFLNLEKKFKRNPALKIKYSDFIREYAELGHLSASPIAIPTPSYFLCHHAVFKDNSESTSLRVVFDGSAPSSSGLSLNDILMVGPNVQDSLFSILVRARQYKFILTGDIEKMYRQVLVENDDRNLQLILWREDESHPIKTLRLNTLTYGTASASYLSTRCLQQIGEEQDNELIKTIIKNDFYVDDLITGSNVEEELSYIQNSVSEALKSSCFNLRKFKTNSTKLFQNTNLNTQENLTLSESSSTLGLGWNPSNDCLHFQVKHVEQKSKITKRSVMSNSFKTFDPLGLLSPVIIQSKMMLQRLWQQQVDWDQPVPQDIEKEWIRYASNLPFILNLQLNRHVLCDDPKLIELHSFSDASERAYGACIYMRSINVNNDVTVQLLCAKSKVAPLKPTTIPRLELCAALLAAKLCKAVTSSLRYNPDLCLIDN
ncbi:uncharacterized protein [Choristoneura fumiferana]|uniref:uncharacterized protein n=1 Tax=Choristoneura fumiferana TaxID=7141 RepID=UPI003D15D614